MRRCAILISVFGLAFLGVPVALYAEEPPATDRVAAEKTDNPGATKMRRRNGSPRNTSSKSYSPTRSTRSSAMTSRTSAAAS